MKKLIAFLGGVETLRAGCIHNGILYENGKEQKYGFFSSICEKDVKTLKVHKRDEKGIVQLEGETMELERRNGTLAVVRDKHDNQYVAILCELYYSDSGLKIYNVIVTKDDNSSAKVVAGKGITKKKWVIMSREVY